MRLLKLLFLITLLPHILIADDVYSLYYDSNGILRPGRKILSVTDSDNASSELADYLNFSSFTVREDDERTFITPKTGEGVIPVLSFHKLGEDPDFELTPGRFEELLKFLKRENYHVISDLQLVKGDFTFAENGKKLIVLGADDGSSGTFYYETSGALKTSPFLMEEGEYIISDQCMVYYLDKHLPLEEGRRNFTFYLAFDAIPFRQTGGGYNPGPPYLAMPAVRSKLQYLSQNYFLGNHTLHHYYSEVVSELEYLFELIGYYDVLESYGINPGPESTLAYSYGIGEIDPVREDTVKSFSYKGTKIIGAFDYNGNFTRPVDSEGVNIYDISRTGVENENFNEILNHLETGDIFINRRAVLVESDIYPFDLPDLTLKRGDQNFILISK